MKTIIAVVVAVMSVWSVAFSQEGFQNYHQSSQMGMASPGAFRYGLNGYDNPAVLGTLSFTDLLFYTTQPDRNANGFRQWGLFGGFTSSYGMGTMLGVHHERLGMDNSTTYTIGAGSGNQNFSWGYSLGFVNNEGSTFQRNSFLRLGTLFRPNEMVSLGVHGTSTLVRSEPIYEFVGDLGIRPFSSAFLTLFGDVAWRNKDFVQYNGITNAITYSAGGVIEPFDGIRISGRYFNTEQISIGLQVSLGNVGVSTQSTRATSGGDGFLTYGIRAGGFDRTIGSSEPSFDHYRSISMAGGVTYQRYQVLDNSRTLLEFLEQLELIKNDENVRGLVLNLSGMGFPRAMLWEVKQKIKEIKAKGKKIVVFIDRLSMDNYAFASYADKIVMDPMGSMTFAGYNFGKTYLKGMYDKLGIGVDELRFFKYKSAVETEARETMSDGDREQLTRLAESFYAETKNEIITNRNISEELFERLVNDTLEIRPKTALALGLVDSLGRWETVENTVNNLENKISIIAEKTKTPIVNTTYEKPEIGYTDNKWSKPFPKHRIAVVYAIGGTSLYSGIEAVKLSKIVNSILKNSDYDALVLRVDSPGGDALAADLVAEELKKGKGKKPIIITQGSVAASGGYWLSMYADTILATPSTITGSIGVISMFLYDKGAKEKTGITTDNVKIGDKADIGFGPFGLIANKPLSAEDRKQRENTIVSLYDDFLEKVAEGRGMSTKDVHEVAQGRIWTGTDGVEKKLVDEIGGLERAIALAKQQAKIPADEEVEVVEFPNRKFIDLSQFTPSLISVDASTLLLKELSETLTKMKNESGTYQYSLPYDTYESLKTILYNFQEK
jgi:protease-4